MKISIGSRIVEGPWGGGNLFVLNLSEFLIKRGHEVIYDLSEPDIDLILLTDPRSRKESTSSFTHLDIKKYKEFVNANTVVVQRINECDERKGTENINSLYLDASNLSDHIVFVSSWLQDIYLKLGMKENKTSVIMSGSNQKIFNSLNASIWNKDGKIKLLTHHWSSHKNKGFDVYKEIDNLIKTEKWRDRIKFTYVGNISEEFKLHNSKIIEPLAGEALAEEIKKHHVYITGSINEPSGNHHIEAAQCGLPILYKQSGGIPEYCSGFGVSFYEDFEERLDEIISNYNLYQNKMKEYPFNSELMCREYNELFHYLVDRSAKSKETHKSIKTRTFIIKQKLNRKFRSKINQNILSKVKNTLRGMLKRNG